MERINAVNTATNISPRDLIVNVGDTVRVTPNKAAHLIISISESDNIVTTACGKSFAYKRLKPGNRDHLCTACANHERRARPNLSPHIFKLSAQLAIVEAEYKILLEARNKEIRRLLDDGVHQAVLCDILGLSQTTLNTIRYGSLKKRRQEWATRHSHRPRSK